MPVWKQMRCIEVIAALLAETLIEMGVMILTEPIEIHWPNGMLTKPNTQPKGKKGKKIQKNKHGIFGEIVADLAPTLPPQQVMEKKTKTTTKGSNALPKAFKTPIKAVGKQAVIEEKPTESAKEVGAAGDNNVIAIHQGLPVQGRRGNYEDISINLIHI